MPLSLDTDDRSPLWRRREVPFLACLVVGFGVLLSPPRPDRTAEVVVALTTMVLLVVIALVLPWSRWPAPIPDLLPLLGFPLVAMMRDASGGAATTLSPMVVVPVIWLAIWGSRWALALATAATALVFVVPLVLVGAPDYPASDWRRAVVWTAVVSLLGPSVQRVVRALRERERALAEANDALDSAGRRWEQLVDSLPDTIVMVVDDELRYTLVTGGGAGPQGVQQWQSRTVAETSNPVNAALLAELYRSALDGVPGRAEIHASTTGHTHEVVAVPLRQHGERRALVVAKDVSLAEQREREIRALHEQVDRLVEEAPTGIAVAAGDGTVLRINRVLTQLLHGTTAVGDTLAGVGLTGDLQALLAGVRGTPLLRAAEEVVRGDQTLLTDVVGLAGADGELTQLLVHVHDITERRTAERQLEHLAAHDPLTGLLNRRAFDDVLQRHVTHCARYGPDGAVLMLDLDHFKDINDTHGHTTGDRFIVEAAAALRTTLRESDTIARLGGDEFAVLTPHGSIAEVRRVAERVVGAVSRAGQAFSPGTEHQVTVSVGAVVVTQQLLSSEQLLAAADLALYDAKDAGRNGYVVHDDDEGPSRRSRARTDWAARTRRALGDDRFVLHVQPVVDLVTGDVRGGEVLLRMLDQGGGLIAPGRFLDIAERTGLAPEVDGWVLDRVLPMLEELAVRAPTATLSMNLSARSVGTQQFVDRLTATLASSTADLTRLVVEITESAAVADLDRARTFADRLHRLGCRLALDDFGAGHGSFYHLKHLPFDQIKIDGEFVRDCTSNEVDRLVIDAVSGFGRRSGREVVAEYVGDAATVAVLGGLGVRLGQGFHLGAPVPWATFQDSLVPTG